MTTEEVLEQIVAKGSSDEGIKAAIRNWNKVIQFDIKDGEKYYLVSNDGSASVVRGTHSSPNVTLSTDESTMLDILNGKLNGIKAAFAGMVKVKGDIFDAQKLVSLLDKIRSQ